MSMSRSFRTVLLSAALPIVCAHNDCEEAISASGAVVVFACKFSSRSELARL